MEMEEETYWRKNDASQPQVNRHLQEIYNGRDTLSSKDIVKYLHDLASTLLEQTGTMHPIDTEVLLLLLSAVCKKELDQDLIPAIRQLVSCTKLYDHISYCCQCILDLNAEIPDKKLKLENLLRAVCEVSFRVFTDPSSLIPPDFFLDLINLLSNSKFKQIGIDTEVLSLVATARESIVPEPPDSITDWNIVPGHKEVTNGEKVFLRPHRIFTPYPDMKTYCDVQFRLTMEDFMFDLRQAMSNMLCSDGSKKAQSNSAIRIYEQVTFRPGGLIFNEDSPIPEHETSWRLFGVKFQKLPTVNWETNPRLMGGSLVFLWDGTGELISATVAGKNSYHDLANGEVTLALEVRPGVDLPLNLWEKQYTMFESVTYFVPNRAILHVLQGFSSGLYSFPMSLLDGKDTDSLPDYLKKSPGLQLRVGTQQLTAYANQPLSSWPSSERLGLDEKQREALYAALRSRVSVIQGPPGTGKTYLAMTAIEALINNKQLWQGTFAGADHPSNNTGHYYKREFVQQNSSYWSDETFVRHRKDTRVPLLVISKTNHAIDQIAMELAKRKVSVLRLGSQATTELKEYSLSKLKGNIKKQLDQCFYNESLYLHYEFKRKQWGKQIEFQFQALKDTFSKLNCEIDCLSLADLRDMEILNKATLNVFTKEDVKTGDIIRNWLGWYNEELTRKSWHSLCGGNVNVDVPKSLEAMRMDLIKIPDRNLKIPSTKIFTSSQDERWILISQWTRLYRSVALQKRGALLEKLLQKYNSLAAEADASLCRTVDVICMTTAGAATHRLLLETLGVKIVIVEEAAEVLESHIVCALTPKVEQLILIGDHYQLRPSLNAHHLAQGYNHDISLFERLIGLGKNSVQLSVQYRMRVEISRLINPIYPNLENHISVCSRPHVPGMRRNVFFYHHTNPEKMEGTGFSNQHEASMALSIALYLCQQQGVPVNKVTILTAYSAQMHLISNMRKQPKWKLLRDLRVVVVDNFQGEENDIIILSLVRNNKRNSTGFLKIANRACVALSRARNGFYIMGNIDLLSQNSPLWGSIRDILTKNEEIGEVLPLRCNHHPDFVKLVRCLDGFKDLRCTKRCCKHNACKKYCHAMDENHTSKCLELVERQFHSCNHLIRMACHLRIQDKVCGQMITWKGSCGHDRETPCHLYQIRTHVPETAFPCKTIVSKELPCKHVQKLPCHLTPDPLSCKVQIVLPTKCSHELHAECGLSRQKIGATNMLCKECLKMEKPLASGPAPKRSKFLPTVPKKL